MAPQDNDWSDWQKYMAAKLDHIDERVSVTNDKISVVREEIMVLRTKNAVWATIIGGASSLLVAIIAAMFSRAQ